MNSWRHGIPCRRYEHIAWAVFLRKADHDKSYRDKEIPISLLHVPAQEPWPDLTVTEDIYPLSPETHMTRWFFPFKKELEAPLPTKQRGGRFYLEFLSQLCSKSPTALWLACAAAEVLLLISKALPYRPNPIISLTPHHIYSKKQIARSYYSSSVHPAGKLALGKAVLVEIYIKDRKC